MTRADIEFYFRPAEPVEPSGILGRTTVRGSDSRFEEFLTKEDHKIIEAEWEELRSKKGDQLFSKRGALVSLYDTQDEQFTFMPTEFKVYVATSRTHNRKVLNDLIYNNMRIGCVGCALILGDGTVYIHKRPKDATHVPDVWDSSFAGLAFIDALNPTSIRWLNYLYQKLEREMGMKSEDLTSLKVSGIHSSGAPDFSCMVDFVATTDLRREDIEARVNKEAHPERIYVKREELPNFLREHYYGSKGKSDMVGDGFAALSGVLNYGDFWRLVSEAGRFGIKVHYGELKEPMGSEFNSKGFPTPLSLTSSR